MVGPVLFLDDDIDLCELLKELAEARGGDVKIASSVGEMIDMGAQALQCQMAFLDIEMGPNQPTGIRAYEWLRMQDFPGRIYFMTGHGASHPLVEKARSIGPVEVLTKPVPTDLLLKILTKHREDE